ncbi:MAG: hypothetical protein H7843_09065 [Nitrospirota bacterium]
MKINHVKIPMRKGEYGEDCVEFLHIWEDDNEVWIHEGDDYGRVLSFPKAVLPEAIEALINIANAPRQETQETSDDTFTASDIHNFYKDIVKGYYKGREEEANALEARIFRAVKEGRVKA